MKVFAKIVSGFKPLTIFAKHSISDVWQGHLASRNFVGEVWEDAYKVSFADFWGSVDLPHL